MASAPKSMFCIYRHFPASLRIAGLIFIVLATLSPFDATAQRNPADAAPQMVGIRFDQFPDADARQILALAERRVPIALLLPNVSTDSYFTILFGAAGAHFDDAQTTRFRWRAGLFDLNLFRPPLALGFTMVDFDRSGLQDVYARWLAFRGGPSLRIGGAGFFIEPRAVGSGGISTIKLGEANYGFFESDARRSITAFETGYDTQLLVQLGPTLSAVAHYIKRRYSGGNRPDFITRSVEGLFTPDPRFQLFGLFGNEKTSWRDRHQRIDFMTIGIRFTPGAGD